MYRNLNKVIQFIENVYGSESALRFSSALDAGDDANIIASLKVALNPYEWSGGTLAEREGSQNAATRLRKALYWLTLA